MSSDVRVCLWCALLRLRRQVLRHSTSDDDRYDLERPTPNIQSVSGVRTDLRGQIRSDSGGIIGRSAETLDQGLHLLDFSAVFSHLVLPARFSLSCPFTVCFFLRLMNVFSDVFRLSAAPRKLCPLPAAAGVPGP